MNEKKMVAKTERVRIRCDVLIKVIDALDNEPELQDIFGGSVSEALIVVADGDDLRIEEGGAVDLTDDQKRRFQDTLNRIIKDNTT